MIRFYFTVLLVVGGLSSQAFAITVADDDEKPNSRQGFFTKADPLPVLSYNEFRRLSDASKREYVQIMQSFAKDLAKLGYEVDVTQAWEPSSRWSFLLSLVQSAQADDGCAGVEFVVRPDGHTCTLVPDDKSWLSTHKQVCSNDMANFYPLSKKCSDKYWAARSDATNKPLSDTARQTLYNESRSYDKAKAQQAQIDREKVQVEDQAALPEVEPLKAAEPAGKKWAPDPEVQVPYTLEQKAKQLEYGSKLSSLSEKKEQDEGARVRCIYAGFTIYKSKDEIESGKSKCEPKTEWKDAAGNVYNCKGESGGKSSSRKGRKKSRSSGGGQKILCNPILFGAGEKGTGLCVARSADATAKCKEESKGDLDKAAELIKTNKTALDELNNTYQRLCQGGEQDLLDAGIDSKNEKRIANLKQTCNIYGNQLWDLRVSSASAAGASQWVPGQK